MEIKTAVDIYREHWKQWIADSYGQETADKAKFDLNEHKWIESAMESYAKQYRQENERLMEDNESLRKSYELHVKLASKRCEELESELSRVKNAGKWISVEDRLPEIAKQVCIVLEMDGNSRAAKSYPGFRANGGWYVLTIPDKSWVPNDDKHYKITHWQPLPAPPQQEEPK